MEAVKDSATAIILPSAPSRVNGRLALRMLEGERHPSPNTRLD